MFVDEAFLSAIAREANGVAISKERSSDLAELISHINGRVADAALSRLGVAEGVETYDSFRTPYASRSEA
jgi:hypothetical protein